MDKEHIVEQVKKGRIDEKLGIAQPTVDERLKVLNKKLNKNLF